MTGPHRATQPATIRGLDQGASGWQTEPSFKLSHTIMFEEHRLPYWDPFGGYGKPNLGAMVPQQFYPLATLVAMHPTPRVYSWWIVARLFIAGFFAALFVRLFFASRWAAIGGGIATMFTGYFLLYYDMPHLSVEVELPMLLWATEIVSRKVTARRIAALGAAVGLDVLGGFPESTALAFTAAGLYAILRLASLPGDRGKRIVALVGAYAVGILLGSIELIPFMELLPLSLNFHGASSGQGLLFDGAWRNGLLTELIPRAFGGGPWQSIFVNGGHSGVRGFFGVSGFLLGMIALSSAWLRRDSRTDVVTFLAAGAAYLIFKRFGNVLVNWTGATPVLVQVQFVKYEEAVLGVFVALLVGFGIGYLRERRAGETSIWIGFAATISLLTLLFLSTRGTIPVGPLAIIYPWSLALGLGFLFLLALAAAGVRATSPRLRFVASTLVLAILVAEPLVTWIYPVMMRDAPPISQNPYAGAPYISYLQAQTAPTHERVFGVYGVLFPNWASAYALYDVRSLEAVILADYLPFVDAFITKTPAAHDDQGDRFVATAQLDLQAPLLHRWLELSSIGYLMTPAINYAMVNPRAGLLGQIMDQSEKQLTQADYPFVRLASTPLGGVGESAFFEHPPRDITFRTKIDRTRPQLLADIALDPAVYDPVPGCGGSVTFALNAFQNGKRIASASRTIDPKRLASDRRWIPFGLDLSKSAGRYVDIHFQTSADSPCGAWALWGEPRFVPANEHRVYQQHDVMFPLAYHELGAYVFRIPNALPRLALYHRAESVNSFKEALSVMTRPNFDVHNDVVVQGALPPLGRASGADRVTITRMRSDETDASVVTGSSGLLMQNDSWYPGWKATVDGRETPILHADGMFRGIPLEAGHHNVVIAYQSSTALAGELLSILGFIIFVVLLADPMRRRLHRRGAAT